MLAKSWNIFTFYDEICHKSEFVIVGTVNQDQMAVNQDNIGDFYFVLTGFGVFYNEYTRPLQWY